MRNKKTTRMTIAFLAVLFLITWQYPAGAEEQAQVGTTPEDVVGEISETTPGNLTMAFKDADLIAVLELLAYKGGVNIVADKEVSGTVTVRLVDVPWERALKSILKINNYGYEREGNIITVTSLEKMASRSKAESELSDIQPMITEIFTLKNLDAHDAKMAISPQLSSRGKISVVQIQGQRGWTFGSDSMAKRERATSTATAISTDMEGRAKILIVSDISPVMERIKDIIKKIDIMPRQVLIEAKILEINHDKLKDFGLDWGTGTTGAESSALNYLGISHDKSGEKSSIAGHNLGSEFTPSGFNPKATSLSGIEPFNAGLEVAFKKLTGAQFEAILHALSEDVDANVLSSPRIMTLDNQEATILVGTKYPILKSNVSGTDTTATTTTLDYFQDIGIQLNVVPQINADNYINMIIHPAVTSSSTNVEAKSSGGTILATYPIISTREAETQIIIKSGETIVIGGLIKDVRNESKIGIPILSSIPLLGLLFQRKTVDVEKIDLLIFIRAFVVDSPLLTEEEQKSVGNIDSADKLIKEERLLKKKQGKGLIERWHKLFRD
jgi:type IV pilus assembly protein PilQ